MEDSDVMSQQKLEPNEAIEIWQVENGFHVHHVSSLVRGGFPIKSAMVFQSFAGLTAWLAQHFSHRQPTVVGDSTDTERGLTRRMSPMSPMSPITYGDPIPTQESTADTIGDIALVALKYPIGGPEHVKLWDAINELVRVGGGSVTTSVDRERAVARIETALRALVLAAWTKG